VERAAPGLPKALEIGGLYTGAGGNTVPLPFPIPDQGLSYTGVTNCNASTGELTLGPTTALDLADVVAGCTTGAQPQCHRHCTVGRTGNDLHYRGYDIVELAKKAKSVVAADLQSEMLRKAQKLRIFLLAAVTVNVLAPLEAVIAPLWVISPPAVTAKVPLTVEVPRSIAFLSESVTFFAASNRNSASEIIVSIRKSDIVPGS
jgi:hypothetical protein